jgi:hypothetical protein
MSLPPNDKLHFRQQLARYMLVAIKYNYRWHYDQVRPVRGYHLAPSAVHYADCSSFSSLAFYAAGVWAQAPVSDPLNMHYSGYGNTESMYAWLKGYHAPRDKYRVGDIALYLNGPSEFHHTTICVIEGDGATAWFASNGQEADPNKTRLHYRSDLTGVYRHPALA